MKEKHMNLFFPQWQGAGRTKELLTGAWQIRDRYATVKDYLAVPVSEEENKEIENDILGYKYILQQLKQAKAVIAAECPNSIFTVGGGCDVEIVTVSYLNDLFNGDLSVIWIDAHGDLNTPETSPSKCFHGMPLRTLMGDGNAQMIETAFSKPNSSQLVLIGQRDLDLPEQEYIKQNNIEVFEPSRFSVERIVRAIRSKGSKNLYIHIDLDVLDFDEFPYVMVPAPDGLKTDQLAGLLEELKREFHIAGLSLLEYTSSEEKDIKILSDIIRMGEELSPICN